MSKNSESADRQGTLSNHKQEILTDQGPGKDGGSADSVLMCCSRSRLLPPSDNMGLLSCGFCG
jgi:hypothetical protein